MFRWTQTNAAKVPGIGLPGMPRDTMSARVATTRCGALTIGLPALVCAILDGLVGAEKYALLIGSVVLVAVLALLTYLTRRLDRHAQGVPLQPTSDTP
jgi:inner membrane protein